MADEESRYDAVLKVLTQLEGRWKDFRDETTALIVEHRKTVNSAISSLAQEALESQDDTKKRLEADSALRAKRQTRTDRKDWALGVSMGCLIVLNGLALIALAIVLILQNWR